MEEYEKYETMNISVLKEEVKRMNKHALFEMAWRLNEVPEVVDPQEQGVWQTYWYERAAKAGHVDAKSRIARFYYDMSCDGAAVENRKKAYRYYAELSNDFDCENLSKDDRGFGETAKIWLGILLCMGNGWPLRDVKNGIKFIEQAEKLTNNLDGYGFIPLNAIGTMYAQGYAQPDEDPSRLDLEKAIKYLSASLEPTKTQKIDKNKIELAEKFLDIVRNNLAAKVEMSIFDKEKYMLSSNTSLAEYNRQNAKERRKKMMELPSEWQQSLNGFEASLKRLREHLANIGW
jgi:hypothetical protein